MAQGTGGFFSERRCYERLPVRGSAAVKVGAGIVEGDAVDISSGGVCLTLPEPLQLGALYSVDLRVEGQPHIETSILGRVCFCIEQSAGYRIGMSCPLEDLREGTP